MKCKGAIFDMDGLMFDTERVYQQTWQELADERNIRLGDGFLKAISGTNGPYMCQVIKEYYHVSDGSFIVAECMERIRKKLSVHVPVKEGVYEILVFFREKGIRTAVASSSSMEQIEANLKRANMRGYFDAIISGTEVENGKPAPDIFLYAAERIECLPNECLVFEDSENGIRAGYAAGCITVMVPDLIEPSPEILPCCSKICRNLNQAMQEIGNL
ncbi:MAG: HAD family phosphatase [Lachnospiraceae bacterium]|nr:HAD family phosphatase [Lachnospiraceae bacterium]